MSVRRGWQVGGLAVLSILVLCLSTSLSYSAQGGIVASQKSFVLSSKAISGGDLLIYNSVFEDKGWKNITATRRGSRLEYSVLNVLRHLTHSQNLLEFNESTKQEGVKYATTASLSREIWGEEWATQARTFPSSYLSYLD